MRNTFTIGTDVHEHTRWLGKDLVAAANDALSAHEQGNYTYAAGRAGVCLEGVLKRMLHDGHQAVPPKATLGQLIGLVRDSGRAPAALLVRLDEANVIRIRAAHEKSSRLEEVSEADSLLILHVVRLVVKWYAEEGRPAGGGDSAGLVPVFLSVGGPDGLDQAQFLELLRAEMRELGVDLCNVPRGTYSKDKPFDQVRDLLTTCRAALVVGLQRSLVYTVLERQEPVSEERCVRCIPTAWNQIEGSIASALRLPVLVLRDDRLHQEGIFEANSHGHQIRDFHLAAERRGLSPELRGFLAGWVKYLHSLPADAR